MSLQAYAEKFYALNMNQQIGLASPHKVCMLLAVIDLIAEKKIRQNRIFFDDVLRQRFTLHFDRYSGEFDRNDPQFPFFYLRSDGFWHHQVKFGQSSDYQRLTTVSGPGQLNKIVAYAYLDEALFLLLQNQYVRQYLSAILLENLTIDSQRKLLRDSDSWDWLECEAIVADYFAMMELELKGERYNKTHHRQQLLRKLSDRTEGAIEFKHQNISAVLIELGYPYISGYKPAFNYQKQLKEAVAVRLADSRDVFEKQVDSFLQTPPPKHGDFLWNNVLEDAPEKRDLSLASETGEYTPQYFNFAELEKANRMLGERGEEFVLKYEKSRLLHAKRDDLASEVLWVSRDCGDGAGYDVRSFDPDTENELFIEVKTSNFGKYQPFYITENEVSFSRDFSDQYSLYRVFNFKKSPKLFMLPGDIKQNVQLEVTTYRAYR